MLGDWLRRLRQRFGRPPGLDARPLDAAVDRRLDLVEREQGEIEARLRLLEYEADIRGERRRE